MLAPAEEPPPRRGPGAERRFDGDALGVDVDVHLPREDHCYARNLRDAHCGHRVSLNQLTTWCHVPTPVLVHEAESVGYRRNDRIRRPECHTIEGG